MGITIDFFGEHRCRLGESPLWDADMQRLWWVDAVESKICAADGEGVLVDEWRFDRMVGSIALARDGLIAALADGFYLIDASTGAATSFARLPCPSLGLRLNDGKMDRSDRFLCGQAQVDDGERGSLWRLDPTGVVTELVTDVRISNAICFSPAGDLLYFADSLEGVIRRYPYDRATGALGAREDFIDCKAFGTAPDGATVDAGGNIWVALVLDQSIACFDPAANLLSRIDVPIPYPSCPAFGGKDLDTLFVTSISNSGHRLATAHPDGGRILAIRGLEARGLPERRFSPSTDAARLARASSHRERGIA